MCRAADAAAVVARPARATGANRVEMDFLADIWVPCPVCDGHRFNRETLQILYKGKSIANVLEMDVQEALEHFGNIPKIAGMLGTLHDVGLDYIKLGQSSTTLSGGEAQRIKLARELVKRSTGRTLYLLDEPTTGLHFDDIKKLLVVLHGFVDAGNSVVVIEHNLDVLKTADWIIDLGPEGGDAGGRIVAEGTPEQVAKRKRSYTGQGAGRSACSGGHRQAPDRPSGAEGPKPSRDLAAMAPRPSRSSAPGNTICRTSPWTSRAAKRPSAPACRAVARAVLRWTRSTQRGQRRYVESLSAYARQFLGQMQKPRVDHVYGLSPAIAIEQKAAARTPRSTVGTVTEIYDYLRVLLARLGTPYCPKCKVPIGTQSSDEIVDRVSRARRRHARPHSRAGGAGDGGDASAVVRPREGQRLCPGSGGRDGLPVG